MPFGHDLFRWRYPGREHRNGRAANVQLLCRRSCGLFQKKKNDAAAVMRSRCALEKLCARSEKRLSKRGIARYGSRPHEDRYRPEHRLKDTPRYVCRTAVRGAAVGETSQRETLSEQDSEKAACRRFGQVPKSGAATADR